jgi:hypothetical protein
MQRNRRKPYGPCDGPELTLIATLAHHHGAARFEISSLSIPDMTQESILASLLTLEYQGYLRFYGADARLTGRGVEAGLFLFSIYAPVTQAAAFDWCI